MLYMILVLLGVISTGFVAFKWRRAIRNYERLFDNYTSIKEAAGKTKQALRREVKVTKYMEKRLDEVKNALQENADPAELLDRMFSKPKDSDGSPSVPAA